MINLNTTAVKIAKKEGLKKPTDIAQIKEVMRLLFIEISTWSIGDLMSVIKKYKK